MKCRAALYAGSIAEIRRRHPQVSLPGGEVGIPASKANDYYTKALAAAQEIMNGSAGAYALYAKNQTWRTISLLFFTTGSEPRNYFRGGFQAEKR